MKFNVTVENPNGQYDMFHVECGEGGWPGYTDAEVIEIGTAILNSATVQSRFTVSPGALTSVTINEDRVVYP